MKHGLCQADGGYCAVRSREGGGLLGDGVDLGEQVFARQMERKLKSTLLDSGVATRAQSPPEPDMDRGVGISLTIVLVLQRHGEILGLEEGDDSLQVITILAGHAHRVALDLRFEFGEIVADLLGNVFR